MTEIFSMKLLRKLTKLYPMTIISSDHKNEIQFVRNHLPCPCILKMIRRNKLNSTLLVLHKKGSVLYYCIKEAAQVQQIL